ncbi:hypothetical protein [Alkaliphilus sp. B6464]|uniref:hypothetical protein n=1 Tax=Alkaliphilus sp. B6464 TaxID=2731219 RepID=UPI001BA4658C|nr:hypothetical protein [Alkaliphilus sp. B6464]QUH20746.1 hypothetical protein HYG84_13285 [Alkaliphilus sp. B6464]
MNDRRNNVNYFGIDNCIAIIVMFMIILLIGLNILRICRDYIIVQHSETKTVHDFESILFPSGTLTLIIESNEVYPLLEIIVNGELVDKFGENNEVTINVTDRDIVQINGSMYNDDVIVSIKDISSNIIDYLSNRKVVVKRNISTLAIIRM